MIRAPAKPEPQKQDWPKQPVGTERQSSPACTHDLMACCWLCSSQVHWWREARLRAGYGEEPPNRQARLLGLTGRAAEEAR